MLTHVSDNFQSPMLYASLFSSLSELKILSMQNLSAKRSNLIELDTPTPKSSRNNSSKNELKIKITVEKNIGRRIKVEKSLQ